MPACLSLVPESQATEKDDFSQERAILAPWQENPYELVSWWDMERFSAEIFYLIGQVLTHLSRDFERPEPTAAAIQAFASNVASPENRKTVDELLSNISRYCKDIGLRQSLKAIDRLVEGMQQPKTNAGIVGALKELDQRIQDEMEDKLFLFVSPQKADFYFQTEPIFGAQVASAFPSATVDIEEAGKCYALGRNTGCVLHLQRVVEVGLRELSKAIGIDWTENRSWDAVLNKIDPELRKGYTDKSDFFKQNEKFCAEAAAMLRSVKIAWRNPTMHVENIYDEEKAADVLGAVKGLMRHLASGLQERQAGFPPSLTKPAGAP